MQPNFFLPYGFFLLALLFAELIVNRSRDEPVQFRYILGLWGIFLLSFGAYLLVGAYFFSDSMRGFSRIVFFVFYYLIFRPDSLLEAVAVILLTTVLFLVMFLLVIQPLLQ